MIKRIYNAAFARLAPPSVYVRRIYRQKTGEILNLENPKKFNEKIQWLKLYYHNPVLNRMADKCEAKGFVKECLGSDRSVPTAAIFDHPKKIRLEGLPQALALKATHGSGWNIISRDKSELKEADVQAYFRFWLSKSYYTYSKEWAYKSISPRVICEPLLVDEEGNLPVDYKVHCFSGKAKFIRLIKRHGEKVRATYDLDWKKLPFSIDSPLSSKDFERPWALQEMIEISEEISRGLPFLRVDFYQIGGKLYVGELTAYPNNGMGRFTCELWNNKIGDMLKLPADSERRF